MEFTELKDDLKKGAKSVYLLEGDDAYFRMKGEELIKAEFLTMPELNFTSFDGESLKGNAITALTSAIKNFPFLAEKRIIKVTEFYPSESEFQTYIKPLFEDFPQTSILIIVNSGAKKGVELKRKGGVTYVNCRRAERETVAKWAYITLRRAGVNASSAACGKIADYCLCNMARVSVEVQKLIDYKGAGEISDGEVDALVFKDADYRLYELTATIPARNFTRYCEIEDEILKKGGDEMYLLNGLFNYFKNLLTCATSLSSEAELAETLKIKDFAVRKNRGYAAAVGIERLKYILSYIYSAISDVKSGKTTPVNALYCVKNCVFFGGAGN